MDSGSVPTWLAWRQVSMVFCYVFNVTCQVQGCELDWAYYKGGGIGSFEIDSYSFMFIVRTALPKGRGIG